MSLLDDHVAGFAASALGDYRAAMPWALTTEAAAIVARLLAALGPDFALRDGVAVHASAHVEDGAVLKGPAVIGPDCRIAAGAYVRDGCWLEADCVLGPGTEVKSSFLFRGTRLAHFNFVGDSIVGAAVNLEAGAVVANYRNERAGAPLVIRHAGLRIETGVAKFGALLGDGVRVGANAVIAPGAIIPRGGVLARLSLTDQGA